MTRSAYSRFSRRNFIKGAGIAAVGVSFAGAARHAWAEEEKKLNDDGYQEKLARALLEGIRDYIAKHPPRPSPVALN